MSNKRPKAEPHKEKPAAEKFAKLVALLKEYPGRTAIELEHLGWRPETHGDLMEAQKAGLSALYFSRGREAWFSPLVVSAPPSCPGRASSNVGLLSIGTFGGTRSLASAINASGVFRAVLLTPGVPRSVPAGENPP